MPNVIEPQARQPRGIVKLNDDPIFGWVRFDVTNNNYFSADSFSCVFAASALPPERNLNWFSQQQDMYVELFIGYPQDATNYSAADLKSWIYGQVDDIDINWVDMTVTVTGRDLTRVFIDAKTTEKFQNQTSSQIATLLATRHKLTAVVTPTKTKVGKFFEIDHVNLQDERSEWDLLQYLASREQFRVWVRGTTLYFMPPPDPASTVPYDFVWVAPNQASGSPAGNFQELQFKRALTISRGIQVTIHSWNKKQAKGFSVSFPTKAKTIQAGKSRPFGNAQVYERTIANLTKQEALVRAQSLYQQIVAHEMKIEGLTLPADDVLDITSFIRFSGTGTAFDQTYYPDSIHRELTFEGGCLMTVSAKNHSPESEIQTL